MFRPSRMSAADCKMRIEELEQELKELRTYTSIVENYAGLQNTNQGNAQLNNANIQAELNALQGGYRRKSRKQRHRKNRGTKRR